VELVRRNLADSRTQAAAMIEAGQVLVSGAPADRASRLVAASEPVTVTGPAPRFVGRGGVKLEAALERFSVDVRGALALDAGASTGGFTDCLLQRGARRVLAVDVGRAQLHERLRQDIRVEAFEGTNIRTVTLDDLGGVQFDVAVADLSFISLRAVADQLVRWTKPGGDLVLLVKPQFEAGRREVAKGRGVIRDPEVWARTLQEVIAALRSAGATMMDTMVSPLRGADGNVEFLAHLRAGGDTRPADPDPLIDRAVMAATASQGPASQSGQASEVHRPFGPTPSGSGAPEA
jgi:23S rRNA (cytidine1920-2'-O)/16S rRNA (cytidine1409-2'-O)-methyltransferase